MSVAKNVVLISEEEYLARELAAEFRHEYVDGRVYAMAGAHSNHNRISGNVYIALGVHLKGKPCQPYASDMKVRVGSKYFYPDVLVDCSDTDGYFTESPTLIVEVLSRSTRRMDETTKRMAYLQIPSLREYVLIEQDFVDIEVIRRSEHWQSRHYFLGDEVTFESVGLTVRVEEIYDRVKNRDVEEWLQAKEQEAGSAHGTDKL